MKKAVSILVVLAMLLSMCPSVFAVDTSDTTVIASGTDVELETIDEAYGQYESIEFEWTAPADGVVTVHMMDADPGWAFTITDLCGLESNDDESNMDQTYTYEVRAGATHSFSIFCYYDWSQTYGTISYEVTFTPGEISSTTEKETYVISSQTLSVGENTVALEANAENSLYEFTPEEAGVYTFTVPEGYLLGFWGTSAYAFDATADKTNTLSYTVREVGPSILIGIVNGEHSGEVVLQVEKTGDATVTEIPVVTYVNKTTPAAFTLPEGYVVGDYVNVYDEVAHTAVLGDDGYYHLDSADGDILLVDLNYKAPLTAALGSERPVMHAYVTDDDGNTVMYDIGAAAKAYVEASDEDGYYPLTEDLMFFYQVYGKDSGTISFALQDDPNYNEECAWMFACLTMTLEDSEPAGGAILSGSGTMEDPYIISGLPIDLNATFNENNSFDGLFYQYTAEKDGELNITGSDDGQTGILSVVAGEEYIHINEGPYAVTAGQVILLNHWGFGAGDYALTLHYNETSGDTGDDSGDNGDGSGDTGDTGEGENLPNTSESMTGSGTKADPFIIDSLPIDLVEKLDAESVGSGLWFQYTVAANGLLEALSDGNACITVETIDGEFLENIHDASLAVTEGTVLLLNLWGYDAGTLEITVKLTTDSGNEGGEEENDTILEIGDNYIELPAAEDEVSYTFTATEDAILYIIATYVGWDSNGSGVYGDDTEFIAGDFEMFCVLSVNGMALENGYYGAVEVVAGEIYTFTWTDACTWDPNQGWEAILNLSYTDELIPVVGTEDLPVELYIDDCPTASIEIAAGATAYYTLYGFAGATFTIAGEGAYVLVMNDMGQWVRYDAVDGVVSAPISGWGASNVQIGNDGSANASFTLDYCYPLGSQNNPQQISGEGEYTLDIPANSEGYYLNWTAEDEGLLTVTVNGASWSFVVNNTTTYVYGDWHSSYDSPVVSSETVAAFTGDFFEIIINTAANPVTYESPEGQVTVTISFEPQEIPLGSEFNPYIVSYYGELPALIDVPAGQEVYVKLSGFDGFCVSVAGEGAYILYGDQKYEAENGLAVMPVSEYSVLVKVGNAGSADAQYAVDVIIPVGHEENPEIITEMGQFTTSEFEADSYDNYYYQWIATCNGTLTVTVDSPEFWRMNIWNTSTYDSADATYLDGSNVITLEVSAGDVVQIYGSTYSRDTWANVAGALTFTTSFEPAHVDEDGDDLCDLCGAEMPAIMLGDVNNDGFVDMFDAADVVYYYTGKLALTDDQLAAADVNDDGVVDMFDAADIVYLYTGKISSF